MRITGNKIATTLVASASVWAVIVILSPDAIESRGLQTVTAQPDRRTPQQYNDLDKYLEDNQTYQEPKHAKSPKSRKNKGRDR